MTVHANRCPDCSAALDGGPACPACGLPLRGPVAVRLWQVSVQLDRLGQERAALVATLRAGGGAGAAPVEPPAPWPTRAPAAPKPRQEWTPQRVQNVLLSTGALLLVTAAIAFTAFTWGRLPIGARGAIMLGMTGVAGWSARWVFRRGLTASAEAIALLTVLFAAIDAYAAHRANVAGLRGTDPATYWTVASGVLAAASAAFARVIPVRSLRYAALAGAQLPLLISAVRESGLDPAERGAFLVAQAALLAVAAPWLGGTATAARLCGVANWVLGMSPSVAQAYLASDRPGVLAGAAVVLAGAATALLWPGPRTVPAGVATLLGVVAALAPASFALTPAQQPAAVVAVGLLVVVAAANAPRGWRLGPLAVGAGTVAVAVSVEAGAVAVAAAAPFSWLSDVWSLPGDAPVRTVLTPFGDRWEGSVVTLAVVAVAALAAAVAGEAAGRRALARWWVAGLAAAAVLVAPLGFATTYRAALVWYVTAGVAGLAASYAVRRVVVALPTTGVLAVATAWSFADETATLVVLLAVTVAYAAYATAVPAAREWAAAVASSGAVVFAGSLAASRGAPPERVGFAVATAAFGLLAAAYLLGGRVRSVEYVAAVAYPVGAALTVEDPGWLAWTLGGGALAAGLSALRPARRELAAGSAALAIGCLGTAGYALGSPVDRAAFFVALGCAAAVAAGAWLRGAAGDRVECVAAAGYAVAVLLALPDPGWLSWVLAAGGVTALADALRPERRYLNWVATGLLTAWTWDRLWLAGVEVPEAYAAPVALFLLGLGHLRLVREPDTGSWAAYGRGLVAAFAPTCLLVLADPGVTRPVLLAVAGAAVLLAGVRRRLQAPLAVGASVLALDALVQLAPVAAALPKWATIAAVGLLVIAVGVTYEDRRRDVARLRDAFDALA